VLTIAMMRRRFRHCMSRRAAKSIPRTYQRPPSSGPGFAYARPSLISAKSRRRNVAHFGAEG
jgi:hypothetical protein